MVYILCVYIVSDSLFVFIKTLGLEGGVGGGGGGGSESGCPRLMHQFLNTNISKCRF